MARRRSGESTERTRAIGKMIVEINDLDELTEINNITAAHWKRLLAKVAAAYSVGNYVQWMGNRRYPGRRYGIVTAVDAANLKVLDSTGMKWTIGASLAEPWHNGAEVWSSLSSREDR